MAQTLQILIEPLSYFMILLGLSYLCWLAYLARFTPRSETSREIRERELFALNQNLNTLKSNSNTYALTSAEWKKAVGSKITIFILMFLMGCSGGRAIAVIEYGDAISGEVKVDTRAGVKNACEPLAACYKGDK
jgi:hypothetical protein